VSTPTATAGRDPSTAPSNRLPIAGPAEVRAHTWLLMRRHRGWLVLAVSMHGLAALAGLVGRPAGPAGRRVGNGMTAATVDRIALLLAGALRRPGGVHVVRVPQLAACSPRRCSPNSGRSSSTACRGCRCPRWSAPAPATWSPGPRPTSRAQLLGALRGPEGAARLGGLPLTIGALVITAPLVAVAALVGLPPLMLGTRWYLARARGGYLREVASTPVQRDRRRDRRGGPDGGGAAARPRAVAAGIDDDLREVFAAERYTLWLRTVWYPITEFAYTLPWSPPSAGAAGWCWPGTRRRAGDRGDAVRPAAR
jgi:hypothetical protein